MINIDNNVLAALVGVFMPMLVSWLKNVSWSTQTKFLLTLVVSVILGAATSYVSGTLGLTLATALADITIVFTASQVVYKLWFSGSPLDRSLTGEVK